MPQRWKTVRIFISSTFRDMHAERDHLVRFVFPELKEKCRQQRVHLIDVDLRWGVTQADAQDGKALDICLDEIDSCRPYFLGLLGHRYGSVPPGEEHSITAQEIYHGVLHNEIPKQVVDLRRIIDGKLEGKALTQEQINCLVGCYPWDADKGKYLLREDASDDELEIIRAVFMQYSAYQRDRSFFFFRSENFTKKLAGAEVEDYFESDKAAQDKLADLKQEIVDEGLPWFEYDDIEAFGEKVGETLWQRIEAELGEKIEEEKDWLEEEAEFHELFMADRTRRFVGRRNILDRMHGFCEQHDEPSVMVITGEPGCGKSALMARFSEEIMHEHPDWLLIPHFVGASPGSTNLRQTLRRLCTHLSRIIESPEEVPEDIKELIQVFPELLTKAAEQRRIVMILDAVNQFEKTDNAHAMRWLPQKLPENVRFVVSTLAGKALDALLARGLKPKLEEVTGLDESEIRELVVDYLKEIRHEFPNKQVEDSFFHKVKAGNPLYILVALEELRVFGKFEKLSDRVEELPDTLPALFDQVLERIESDFNPELVRDCMSYIACGRQGMTSEELQTLLRAHAPHLETGAEPEKLPDMLWACLYRAFGACLFERSGVIDFFHGQLKEAVGKRYLQKGTDRKATHKTIADYFENRWREPYNRALDELPHQRTKATDWDGVERTLTDLQFIEAKCTAGMTYDLIADYDLLGVSGAKPAPPIKTALVHDSRYGIQCPFCLAWSEIEKQKVGQLSQCSVCGKQMKINPFCIKAEWCISDAQKVVMKDEELRGIQLSQAVSEFTDFLSNQAHILSIHPELTFQQAVNMPNTTAPAIAARSRWKSKAERRKWLKWVNKPQYNNPCLMTLAAHSYWITNCVYSHTGEHILSASNDKTLKIWDAKTGGEITTLRGHNNAVNACAYSPGGRRIVSGSMDKTLKIWDAKTGGEITTLRGHNDAVNACAYSPDGKRIVSASDDKTLKIWDAETGEELVTLGGYGINKTACVYSPDGRFIVSGSDKHYIRLTPCDYSPDGQRIVLGLDVAIWDTRTLESLSTLFKAGDNVLKICEPMTGEKAVILTGHEGWVSDCDYSPDGRRIVSGSQDSTLKIWDAETGKELATLSGHNDSVSACAYSPDGRFIVSGSNDFTLKIWDAKRAEELAKMNKLVNEAGYTHLARCYGVSGLGLACSPNGRRLVSGSYEKALKIWDTKTGKELGILTKQDDLILTCAYSPDGDYIVLSSNDETLKILNTNIGLEMAILERHDWGSVTDCAYSPDGHRIVSASSSYIVGQGPDEPSGEGELIIWDMETGAKLAILTGHDDMVFTCAYSPDGRRIVSGSWDSTLKIWNAVTGEELATLTGHDGYVTSCAYSPDGRRIISGSDDNVYSGDESLKMWDAVKGKELATLRGHNDAVNACTYTLYGRQIISVSSDATVRVWDSKTLKEEAIFFTNRILDSLTYFLSGIATHDSAGNVYILHNMAFNLGPPLITPVRLYIYRSHLWDLHITSICQWCGKRLPVSDKMLDVIGGISRNAGLSTDQSPCIELPEDAWDEPRLLSECPHCHKPLKFNPFIVDNRV